MYGAERYRPGIHTLGKGIDNQHLPWLQYKVYTCTVCTVGWLSAVHLSSSTVGQRVLQWEACPHTVGVAVRARYGAHYAAPVLWGGRIG